MARRRGRTMARPSPLAPFTSGADTSISVAGRCGATVGGARATRCGYPAGDIRGRRRRRDPLGNLPDRRASLRQRLAHRRPVPSGIKRRWRAPGSRADGGWMRRGRESQCRSPHGGSGRGRPVARLVMSAARDLEPANVAGWRRGAARRTGTRDRRLHRGASRVWQTASWFPSWWRRSPAIQRTGARPPSDRQHRRRPSPWRPRRLASALATRTRPSRRRRSGARG